MPYDPLATVLRLRQRAVDEARVNMAQAVSAETEAADVAHTAEGVIEVEAARAADTSGSDDLVEAFAAWLPAARQRALAARAEQERLATAVNCRRAELAATRAGLEVIETLLREKRDALALHQSVQMQRAIDEAAARRRLPP